MKSSILALAIASALTATASSATDLGHGLTLKGFGTVGVVHSDTTDADYVANSYFQPVGAGATDRTSFNVDTKAGLQMDWKATDRLSFTAQLISKKRPSDDWVPQLEWGFAKFQATPEMDVRVGRIRPPIYLLSDYLDVSYANPWVRPPIEFYATAPLPRMEGIDLLWRPSTGDVSWLIQPYYGKSKLAYNQGLETKFEDIMGLNVSASRGDLTVRANYVRSDMIGHAPQFDQYIGMLNAVCAGGDPVACTQSSALAIDGDGGSFAALGVSWDNGDYFVTSELGQRKTDNVMSDMDIWYISAGARLDKWTPYATYSLGKNKSPKSFTAGSGATNTIVTGLLQNNQMDQSTITLGARYDIVSNVAIKAQWDHVMTNCGPVTGTCGGYFVNASTAFKGQDQSVNVISVSVDFVF
ncbi:MAG: hypothetical protein B7Y41_15855 [Hydrogenophilales bacterium 28-61-23]|nr:MAG: hypothetical protein B7Y41_15855 [Hydrogenophilales bacterium 28-61-23]